MKTVMTLKWWVESDINIKTSSCELAPGFVNYKIGCTRLAAASDKTYQLLAHGRWFSPGTPTSSTTKTGRHDITEIVESDVKHHTLSILLFVHIMGACIFKISSFSLYLYM
jgi:hypothetical protein